MRTLTVAIVAVIAVNGALMGSRSRVAKEGSAGMNNLVGTLQDTLQETKTGLQTRREKWAEYSARQQNLINDNKDDVKEFTERRDAAAAKESGANAKANTKQNEIAQCNEEIAAAEAEMDAATKQRDAEKAEYNKTLKDVNESISAIERANSVLKAKMGKTAQAALLDVAALPTINSEAKETIQSFLQQPAQENVHGYQSGAMDVVFGMLEKLLDDFRNQRRDLDKTEADAKFEYKFLMQNQTGFVANKNADKDRKTGEKGEALETAGEAAEDKAKAMDMLAAAEADLKENTDAFNAKEKITNEENAKDEAEIKALTAGIADLSPQFIQISSRNRDLPLRSQAVQILEDDAKKIGSPRLNLLAQSIAANPFAKVSKMIRDMVVKLREEAQAEAEHHGFCQGELATNKQTRDSKSDDLEALTGKVNDCKAKANKKASENAELQAKDTNSKKVGVQDKKDLVDDLAAYKKREDEAAATNQMIQNAKKSLGEFFAQSDDKSTQTTINALLDEIAADMQAKVEECQTNASQAQAGFDERAQERRVKEAVFARTIQGNTEAIGRINENQKNFESDKSEVSEALDSANEYYEKLKPQCVTQPVSYEERVQMREEEIQSLKEALEILQGSAGAAAGASGNV